MSDPHPPGYCFRTLVVALCYALVLQAFFAGFGNGIATGYASGAADSLIICHGSGGPTPPPGVQRDPTRHSERPYRHSELVEESVRSYRVLWQRRIPRLRSE